MLLGTLLVFSCSDDDDELPFNGSDNSIISFSLTVPNGDCYPGAITGNKIVVTAPLNVSLTGAKVNFSLCEQASVTPDPTEITDWDTEQAFTVTAYNQETKKYTYSVTRTEVSSEGEVILITQADVDALAASGITIIEGDLIIGNNNLEEGIDTIKDLSALSNLIEVKQNIIVNNSFAGTSLRGLEKIRSAAGLYLGTTSTALNCLNEFDVELSALKNLGQLVVNSTKVKSLHLPALQETGWLYLSASKLGSIDFSSLVNCVTNFTMKTSANTMLTSIALPVLESIGGIFTLQYYQGVTELSCPKLEKINGTLIAKNLTKLHALAFPELKEISGDIDVAYTNSLTSFSMPKIEQCNQFILNLNFSNPQVAFQSLNLQSLKSVNGDFKFTANTKNEMDVMEFPALERVSGTLNIQHYYGPTFSTPQLSECATIMIYYIPEVEKLDFTAIENLQTLTIGGCSKLTEVESRPSIVNLTINALSEELPPFPFKDLQEITGTFELDNFKNNPTYEITGIKKINVISGMGVSVFSDLAYPDLDEVGSATFQMYLLNYLRLQKLKLVRENFTFSSLRDLEILELPVLEKIGGKFTLSGMTWLPSDFTQMDLPMLTEVGSVSITDLRDLSNFSALKNVVEALNDSQWKVSGCAYNPTLDDMKAGRYTPEN